MKRGGFEPETVSVAPTSTTVVEVDVRAAKTLTLYVKNLDGTQTFAGDNGKRDWTDAQLRVAIEAELSKT